MNWLGRLITPINDENDLTCPICHDIMMNCVALPCGDEYCTNCIEKLYQEEKIQNFIFSPTDINKFVICPICRCKHNTTNLSKDSKHSARQEHLN